MSGVTLETKVVAQPAQMLFKELRLLMTDTTPVMRAIGVALVEEVHTSFDRGVDPWDQPWAALNPDYESTKTGPGILRESAMRGGLMGSITFKANHESVEVGTSKIYAAVHQFGATIEPRHAPYLVFSLGGRVVHATSVTIPARPYLGLGPRAERAVLETMEDAYDRAIGPYRIGVH